MRITVQVIVDTQDHTEPVVCEVFALKRDALAADLVGLHLAEAHELVTALQEVLVPAQISEALAQRRCCAHCGRAYRHKDTKKKRCIPRGSARNFTRSPPGWRPNSGRRTPQGWAAAHGTGTHCLAPACH